MNQETILLICQMLGLGQPEGELIQAFGGLVNIMWRLDTNRGSYAIKQLAQHVNIENEQIKNNYELTEEIALSFAEKNIPAICAIKHSSSHIISINGYNFMIYPWIEARALGEGIVSRTHALQVAGLLAKMHTINLYVPKLKEPDLQASSMENIISLILEAEVNDCLFSAYLKENQEKILAINDAYQRSIPVLKNNLVVSHGDLDQKNVLWNDEGKPFLIDWEGARKINQTYDAINVCLDWSGIITKRFDKDLFLEMLKVYQGAGLAINKEQLPDIFSSILGNWLNWVLFNIKRACNYNDLEQQKLSVDQVELILPIILRLKNLLPQLTKDTISFLKSGNNMSNNGLGLPAEYQKFPEYFDAHNVSNDTNIKNGFIESILRKHNVGTVLDLTCGTGSQVFFLAKHGYGVVGSDFSPALLDIAREKARNSNFDIKFIDGDMRTLKVGQFDAVITIFNAVGHLTKADFEKAMSNIYDNLKPGGLYIFDILNLEAMTDAVVENFAMYTHKKVVDVNLFSVQCSTIDRELGLLTSYDYYVTQKNVEKPNSFNNEFSLQIYTAKELREMLARNGFETVDQCGFDGTKLIESKTISILTVARKV